MLSCFLGLFDKINRRDRSNESFIQPSAWQSVMLHKVVGTFESG